MALTPRSPVRDRDRELMVRLIDKAGYGHAVESLADVVAVAASSAPPAVNVDERMGAVSRLAAGAVLDAMIHVARSCGWDGAR